jgi:hypothetical protein
VFNNPKKLIGLSILSIGALDLALGDTDKQVLPSFIGNVLTQQIDIVLIGIGILLMFYM